MPDIFATVVRDHNQLLAAIRKRIADLDISYESLELTAGVQSGYLSKILGTPPPKRLHPFLAFVILESLGLRVELHHDDELLGKVKNRLTKRKSRKPVRALERTRIIEVPPDHRFRRARAGGLARARLPNLSDINRRANLTRWQRWREVRELRRTEIAAIEGTAPYTKA